MNKSLLLTMMFCSVVTVAMAATGKAVIKGTAEGSAIAGLVDLVEEKGGVTLNINVSNVPPGMHGIHLHENASCADLGKAAGGHFNPDKTMHGLLPKDGGEHAHAGDMGNVEVDAKGNGALTVFMPGLTLSEGMHSVARRSVILHEKADDFGQPTGNAGGRIACGIIDVVEPAKK